MHCLYSRTRHPPNCEGSPANRDYCKLQTSQHEAPLHRTRTDKSCLKCSLDFKCQKITTDELPALTGTSRPGKGSFQHGNRFSGLVHPLQIHSFFLGMNIHAQMQSAHGVRVLICSIDSRITTHRLYHSRTAHWTSVQYDTKPTASGPFTQSIDPHTQTARIERLLIVAGRVDHGPSNPNAHWGSISSYIYTGFMTKYISLEGLEFFCSSWIQRLTHLPALWADCVSRHIGLLVCHMSVW